MNVIYFAENQRLVELCPSSQCTGTRKMRGIFLIYMFLNAVSHETQRKMNLYVSVKVLCKKLPQYSMNKRIGGHSNA